jgi:uncharacterized protein YbjT (DUF2867 family)
MPVVVTGAAGLIGRHAVAAFAGRSPEVRAFIRRREAASSVRALGAKVAVGEIDDVDTLAVVMQGAHTVCHLAEDGPDSGEVSDHQELLGAMRSVLEAAKEARVRRLLYVSCSGAGSDATAPFLRAKGDVEDEVRGSGLQHAIVRCSIVYGRGSPWLQAWARASGAWRAPVIGPGSQMFAPVYVQDVAAVLAAADDRDAPTTGTWGLEGPDRVSADGLTDLVAGRPRRKVHIPVDDERRALRLLGGSLPISLLEILAGDRLADGPDAAAEFGVPRTPLRDGLRRSLGQGRALEGWTASPRRDRGGDIDG